jgi:hypothetical protein
VRRADDLISKLRKGDITSNEFDVLWEIEHFEPCETYSAVKSNWAGTKLIYTRQDGSQQTCRARDWSRSDTVKEAQDA